MNAVVVIVVVAVAAAVVVLVDRFLVSLMFFSFNVFLQICLSGSVRIHTGVFHVH